MSQTLDRIAATVDGERYAGLLQRRDAVRSQLLSALEADLQPPRDVSLGERLGNAWDYLKTHGDLPPALKSGMKQALGLATDVAVSTLSFEARIGYAALKDLRAGFADGPTSMLKAHVGDLAKARDAAGELINPRALAVFKVFDLADKARTASAAFTKIAAGIDEATSGSALTPAETARELEQELDRLDHQILAVETAHDPVAHGAARFLEERGVDPGLPPGALDRLADGPAGGGAAPDPWPAPEPPLVADDTRPAALERELDRFVDDAIQTSVQDRLAQLTGSREFDDLLATLGATGRNLDHSTGANVRQEEQRLRDLAAADERVRAAVEGADPDPGPGLVDVIRSAGDQLRRSLSDYQDQKRRVRQMVDQARQPPHAAPSGGGAVRLPPIHRSESMADIYRQAAAQYRAAADQYRDKGDLVKAQECEREARKLDQQVAALRSR